MAVELSAMPWNKQILLGATNTLNHCAQKFVTVTQMRHAVEEYEGLGLDDSALPAILGHLNIGVEYINNVRVLAGVLQCSHPRQYVEMFPLDILDRNSASVRPLLPLDNSVDIHALLVTAESDDNVAVWLKSLTLSQLMQFRTLGIAFSVHPKTYYLMLCELYARMGIDITRLPASDMLLSIPPDVMTFVSGKIAEETEDNIDLLTLDISALMIEEFSEQRGESFKQALDAAYDDCVQLRTALSFTTVVRLYKGMMDSRAKPTNVRAAIAALGYAVNEDKHVKRRETIRTSKFKPEVYDLPPEYVTKLEINSMFVQMCPTNVPNEEIKAALAQIHEADYADYLCAIYRFEMSYVLVELIDALLTRGRWIVAFEVYYSCFTSYYAAVREENMPGWQEYFKTKTATMLSMLNVSMLDNPNRQFIEQHTTKY